MKKSKYQNPEPQLNPKSQIQMGDNSLSFIGILKLGFNLDLVVLELRI